MSGGRTSGTDRGRDAGLLAGEVWARGAGSLGLQPQTRMDVLLSSYGAVSALVEVEMEVEGGRSVLSDEQSGGAPRAQRRVQDAHCTTKWPHSGSQLGMAARCGTHHTLALCGTRFDPQKYQKTTWTNPVGPSAAHTEHLHHNVPPNTVRSSLSDHLGTSMEP